MYAIVTDGTFWWIQGDEGRVNEQPRINRRAARNEALAMQDDGKEVDTDSFYVQDNDEDGPDWDHPVPLN